MGSPAVHTLLLVLLLGLPEVSQAQQVPVDVTDLADYRLTQEVFNQFVQASQLVADITRDDPKFTYAPLFTRDVALAGDAPTMTMGIIARLENHPALAGALQKADITPREYAKFAISLVGAHLANGFLNAGVLRRVPSGAPTINVEFVRAHEVQVREVLQTLGIDD